MTDKIHMTEEQGRQYWNWMIGHKESCMEMTGFNLVTRFRKVRKEGHGGYVLMCFESVDWYLFNYCGLDFIQIGLKERYGEKEPENRFYILAQVLYQAFGEKGACAVVDHIGDYDYLALIRKIQSLEEKSKE